MNPTIDDVKAFWNKRPCNIRHSRAPVGTKEYFIEVEKRKYFVEPHIPGFAQFELWKGKKVLEVGCGIGTDTIRFARAGAQVTAVDLSDESLEFCKQRVSIFGYDDRVRVLQANCEELSKVVKPEAYDLIYSFGVIHHTPDPARAIEELAKFAGPDTKLKLMLYAKYSIKSLQMLIGNVTCEAQSDVPVAYTYTKRGLHKLLAPHFKLTGAKKDHIFPWRIKDYIEYRYKKKLIWRMMPWPVFRALERMFGWHWLVDAKLVQL